MPASLECDPAKGPRPPRHDVVARSVIPSRSGHAHQVLDALGLSPNLPRVSVRVEPLQQRRREEGGHHDHQRDGAEEPDVEDPRTGPASSPGWWLGSRSQRNFPVRHRAGSRPDLHKNESYVSCQSSVTNRLSARRRAITIAPRTLGASCGARWRLIRNSQSSAATVTRKSQAGQSIGSTSRALRPTSSNSTIPGLEDTNLCLDSRT